MTAPTVDQRVATLHEFHEWRQEAELAAAHWDIAVMRYEEQIRGEERESIIEELRSITNGVLTGPEYHRVGELLDQLA
jgi:hypothetical protein